MKREHSHTKKARAHLSRAGYRAGGHVKEGVVHGVHAHEENMHKGRKKTPAKKLADGGHAHGGKAKHRADKLARGGKPKGGHGKVTVNVINAHGGAKPPMAMKPPPMMPPPGAGPGGPPPPGAGPMPPPGGPPMNRGGRARSRGGKASDSQREEKGGMPKGHFHKGGKTKGPKMTGGAGSGVGRLEKAAAEAKRVGGKR